MANKNTICGFDRNWIDLDGGPAFCDECVAAIEKMDKEAENARIQQRRETD